MLQVGRLVEYKSCLSEKITIVSRECGWLQSAKCSSSTQTDAQVDIMHSRSVWVGFLGVWRAA